MWVFFLLSHSAGFFSSSSYTQKKNFFFSFLCRFSSALFRMPLIRLLSLLLCGKFFFGRTQVYERVSEWEDDFFFHRSNATMLRTIVQLYARLGYKIKCMYCEFLLPSLSYTCRMELGDCNQFLFLGMHVYIILCTFFFGKIIHIRTQTNVAELFALLMWWMWNILHWLNRGHQWHDGKSFFWLFSRKWRAFFVTQKI